MWRERRATADAASAHSTGRPEDDRASDRIVHYAILLAILIAATALRLVDLSTTPPGLFFDEGANGIDALSVLAGENKVFFPGNQGREPFYIYAVALSFKLLGASPISIRLVSVAIGMLTVAATYVLARDLLGRRAALLATAIIAGSFWHISLSRLGFRAVALPLFETLAAICVYRGITRRSPAYWAGAGLFAGGALYTYLASRAAPFWLAICAGLALLAAIRSRSAVRHILFGIALATVVAAATVAPLAYYFLHHQDQFFGRIASTSVHGDKAKPSENVALSTARTLGLFFVEGDSNPRHNLPGRPAFDPVVAVAFACGVVMALRRVRSPASYIPLIWTGVMLAPGALSTEAPHYLRTAGIMPAIFLFPAVALDRGTDWLGVRGFRLAPAVAALVVIVGGAWATWDYFGRWAGRPDVYDAFQGDVRDAVRFAATWPVGTQVLVSGESYRQSNRLRPNPISLYAGSERIDRVFDGLRGIIIPADPALDRLYLYPAGYTRDDGAYCPYLPCFGQSSSVDGPGGIPAFGVFRVRGADSTPGPPPRPLVARFADNLTVRGYELDPILVPGRVTHLTLHTTIGRPLGDRGEWKLFAHLVGADGVAVASAYGEELTPASWQEGDYYIAWLDLIVPEALRPGLYRIELGVFEAGSQARVPLFDAAGRPIGDTLLIQPLRAPDLSAAEPAAPGIPLAVALGDRIVLAGYDLELAPDRGTLDVRLHWQAKAPPQEDYTVFVHLVSEGKVVAQRDAQPASGRLPTSVWRSGETIVDEHRVQIPAGLSGSTLDVIVGMYELSSGKRLPVQGDGALPGADSVTLTRLAVP